MGEAGRGCPNACVNVRGKTPIPSRLLREEERDFSVNSEQLTVNNEIHVRAKHLSPAISDIYGAMFIGSPALRRTMFAPYKTITRSLAFARDDKVNSYQSTDNSLMLPHLLWRGYNCIFQGMTLVNRYLAKAIFELTLRDLHLKVEAIKKNMHVCVRPQTDISGRHTGLPLHKNRKRSLAPYRKQLLAPPIFNLTERSVVNDKANGYQLTAKSYISAHYLIIIFTNYFLL
ncbi:hypothetical protein D0T66_11290 [Dysgonomonas sp. 25]|nr:hypothetical protein [Dysgonomonas sp. 25]